jgi:hypothetical protein
MTEKRQVRPILDLAAPAIYQHVGEVTVYFAMLESILGTSIGRLLFRDEKAEHFTGAVVTAELSFRNKLALFASTYRLRLPKEAERPLQELCNRLEGVEAERNQVIHSVWAVRKDGIYRMKLSAKRTATRLTDLPITTEGLEAIRERIAVLAADIRQFVDAAMPKLKASRA